jgi:hypothetical protein
MTAKDFFLYIGVMITLYVSSVSLVALLFQIINKLFPDSLYFYGDVYSVGVRMAIAALVVIFPIFLWLSHLIHKELVALPEKRNLEIRKWLTYLTLLVAGIAVAVDLVVVVNSFLGGEITTRFILKALVVVVVAGGIFYHYLTDIRQATGTNLGRAKLFSRIAIGLVLVSVVGGFFAMGSPMQQRKILLDEQKIADLSMIQSRVVYYWQQKQRLPVQLSDLNDPITGFTAPTDSDLDEAYEYRALSGTTFELCATFNTSSSESVGKGRNMPMYYDMGVDSSYGWQHEAGRMCFERTIDAELYPPAKPVAKPAI